MTVRRINPYGRTCQVTLDLPWDVAEQLLEQSPAVLTAVLNALRERSRDVALKAQSEAEAERDRRRQRDKWTRLARVADRELRRRLRSGAETRGQILRSVAEEHGVKPGLMQPLLSVYRRELRARIAERRRAQIIHHYFSGLSNAEIGARLRPPMVAASVSNVIRKERRLIQALLETNAAVRRAEARLSDE